MSQCEPGLACPLISTEEQSHKAWRMVLSFSLIQLGQSYLYPLPGHVLVPCHSECGSQASPGSQVAMKSLRPHLRPTESQ